ncbi:aminopeptidase [alpha proteobacterium AAP81b]|nr:aminopeptidase [alpha proteobacterium AAP81b]
MFRRALPALLPTLIVVLAVAAPAAADPPTRARGLGIAFGTLPTGPLNAITDVPGVRVGQVTRREGASIRTGVTAILPHGGNLFQDKVPAAIVVANGFGKLAGLSQVQELGEIEAPVVLTNTLAVAEGIAGSVEWSLAQPGNERVRSVNAIVGETNDGELNDIRARMVTKADVRRAIETAVAGPVAEGAVGAGTGTMAFGWKGGIGTASRRLPDGSTVGVLVQSNFGGALRLGGRDLSAALPPTAGTLRSKVDGSIMIVVATDAPLSDRNLRRLAFRAFAGLARTGSAFSNGSGDYAIAFSTADAARRTPARRSAVASFPEVPNDLMTPLFIAVTDATEEAIANSLTMAETTTSRDAVTGETVTVRALPLDVVRRELAK